jgi:hypothetical protein
MFNYVPEYVLEVYDVIMVIMSQRSKSDRLISVNETKMKCIEHDLLDDLATKILFTMLDNYHKKGTIYINKELKFCGRHDIPRKYVINLYNDRNKKDCVLIRSLNDVEEQSVRARARMAQDNKIIDIRKDWVRDPVSNSNADSDSDSDSSAPDLIV